MFETRAIVKQIGDTKTFKNDFKVREMMVTRTIKLGKENNAKRIFTDHIFKFTQDRTVWLDKYTIGEDVKIGFDITSNWWKNAKGEDILIGSLTGFSINSYGKPTHTCQEDIPKVENDGESHQQDDLPF